KREQVDEVSSRGEYRAAVVAGTEIHLTEQAFKRGVGDHVAGQIVAVTLFRSRSNDHAVRLVILPWSYPRIQALHRLRADVNPISGRQVADDDIEDSIMHLKRVVVDLPGNPCPAQL